MFVLCEGDTITWTLFRMAKLHPQKLGIPFSVAVSGESVLAVSCRFHPTIVKVKQLMPPLCDRRPSNHTSSGCTMLHPHLLCASANICAGTCGRVLPRQSLKLSEPMRSWTRIGSHLCDLRTPRKKSQQQLSLSHRETIPGWQASLQEKLRSSRISVLLLHCLGLWFGPCAQQSGDAESLWLRNPLWFPIVEPFWFPMFASTRGRGGG